MMLDLIALLLPQSGPPPAPVFADAASGAPATLLLESLGEPVVRRRNDAGGNEYVYVSPGSSLEFERNGEITLIAARLPIIVDQTLPPGMEPILHGGSSFADAIVLKSHLESLGVRAESAYL